MRTCPAIAPCSTRRPAPEFAPPDAIVVRYSEIFLKGENRRLFEDVLVRNVQRTLVAAACRACACGATTRGSS